MKQMIPVISNLGKKSILLLFAAFCFTGTVFAQNATNGGSIAVSGSTSQTICPGETPSMITSVDPASGGDPNLAIEYMWMYGFSANFNFVTFNDAPGVNNGANYQPPAVGTTTYFFRCARRAGFGTFQAESNFVVIDVASSPTADFDVPANLYGGATVNLTAANSPNTTFTWDFTGDGFPNAFGQNGSFTYFTPGTYTITLTATSQATGCVTTTSSTFTVSAPAEANIADPCFCGNPNNLFTATSYFNHDYILINSNPGESWFFNNTGATTIFNSSLTAIPNGTPIPEIQPGVYFLNLWFNGAAGGWSATGSNGQFTLATGPGAINPCPPCFNPLPVELKDFTATAEGNGVKLSWRTESESNNSHFEVETSLDGSRFDYIGKVEGAGNSNTSLYYTYFVENAVPGENYFRLKQVDFDGENEFSPIVSLRIGSDETFLAVVPNPVAKNAIIRLGDNVTPGTKIELVSSTGQIVKVIQVTNSSENVNMENLPSGIYFLRVENAPRSAQAYYKVIKQ